MLLLLLMGDLPVQLRQPPGPFPIFRPVQNGLYLLDAGLGALQQRLGAAVCSLQRICLIPLLRDTVLGLRQCLI